MKFSDQLRKIADQMDDAERRGDGARFVDLTMQLQTLVSSAMGEMGKVAVRGGLNNLLDELFRKAGV